MPCTTSLAAPRRGGHRAGGARAHCGLDSRAAGLASEDTSPQSYPQGTGRKMCFPRAESVLVVPAVTTSSGPEGRSHRRGRGRRRCAGWVVSSPGMAAGSPASVPVWPPVCTQAVLTPLGSLGAIWAFRAFSAVRADTSPRRAGRGDLGGARTPVVREARPGRLRCPPGWRRRTLERPNRSSEGWRRRSRGGPAPLGGVRRPGPRRLACE